ncbi:MAG: FHA domain-containing protein [Ilumatobacteraceae bacterium]
MTVQYVFCNQCGHRNPPVSTFCSVCGGVLDKPSLRTGVLPKTDPLLDGIFDDDNAVVQEGEVAPGEVMLVIRQGPEIGTRYSLVGEQISVGRVPDNDIQLDDVTVSRQHAVLVRQGAAWLVRDLGSLNGTYVNNERVDESVIEHGDALQIGRFHLVAFFG